VSADEPAFAPGAGAPTVGAGSVCLCRSTAPVRKGFSRQAHIRPRGGGSYSRGQDQSAFVEAPHRCERVSADEPAFAPGAGAPTVGGGDQAAFVGAPPGREGVWGDEPAFAPGAGSPTGGAGSGCLCRSTAPVRRGFSRRARIRPRGGGSYSRGRISLPLYEHRPGAKGFQQTTPHSPPGRGLSQTRGRQ